MKCVHKSNGIQCNANAMTDSKYCFAHNPETKERHLEASRKGGGVGIENDLVLLEPIDLTNPKAILYLLADVTNRTRKINPDGSMCVKTANCIGHLASKMIEAQKLISLEERLSKLEKGINIKGGHYGA